MLTESDSTLEHSTFIPTSPLQQDDMPTNFQARTVGDRTGGRNPQARVASHYCMRIQTLGAVTLRSTTDRHIGTRIEKEGGAESPRKSLSKRRDGQSGFPKKPSSGSAPALAETLQECRSTDRQLAVRRPSRSRASYLHICTCNARLLFSLHTLGDEQPGHDQTPVQQRVVWPSSGGGIAKDSQMGRRLPGEVALLY